MANTPTAEKSKPETPVAPAVPYLKKGVYWRVRAFLAVGIGVMVWLALGAPTAVVHLQNIPLPNWIVSSVVVVFTVVVTAIESIPGDRGKAALVFWRLRDPLPGHRAFDKASLNRDTRIDLGRLKEALGGKLPRTPKDQNSTWYRLFKSLEQNSTIQAMHFEYLLFRDLAWMGVVLAVLAAVLVAAALVFKFGSAGLLAIAMGAFVLCYLLFRQAGSERGHRLVNQVLVTATLNLPAKGK